MTNQYLCPFCDKLMAIRIDGGLYVACQQEDCPLHYLDLKVSRLAPADPPSKPKAAWRYIHDGVSAPSKPEEGSELMDAVREMDLLMEKDYSLGPDAMAKRMAWIKLKCRLAASAGEPCEPTPPGSVPVFGQDVSPEGITTAMGYRTEDGVTHFTSIETAKPTNPNPIPNPRERIWWSPSFDQCFIGPTIPGNAITYYPASRCIKAEDRVKELEGERDKYLTACENIQKKCFDDSEWGRYLKLVLGRGPQGEGC